MKQILFPVSLLICLYACNNSDKQAQSENDVDAARNFIQAALYGDYQKAKIYMLADSVNKERMDLIQRVPLSPDEKKGLAEASINIHKVDKLNDSTTIVIYSNSFKNDHDTLKVVKDEGAWLVDFNYLFDHDADSLSAPPPVLKTDSTSK